MLNLAHISKRYAGVPALSDVSVAIRAGEVHAILGENGAGKSTLMNVASGTVQPDAGSIAFAGATVALTPAAAARLGIAIVHQHPAVLPDLTVLENLRVALPDSAFAGGPPEAIAERLLDGVGLRVRLRDRVERLTVAQKHLLEIAKAFALAPRVLILDEPTAPLGPASVDLVFSRVRRAVADGVAVVYITHRLAEVRELADRVTVLRDGRLRGEVRGRRHHRRRAARADRRPHARLDVPGQARHAARRRGRVRGRGPDRRRLPRRVADRPARADHRGRPASPATARASCCARSPASRRSAGACGWAAPTSARPTCCTQAAFMPGRPPRARA